MARVKGGKEGGVDTGRWMNEGGGGGDEREMERGEGLKGEG